MEIYNYERLENIVSYNVKKYEDRYINSVGSIKLDMHIIFRYKNKAIKMRRGVFYDIARDLEKNYNSFYNMYLGEDCCSTKTKYTDGNILDIQTTVDICNYNIFKVITFLALKYNTNSTEIIGLIY